MPDSDSARSGMRRCASLPQVKRFLLGLIRCWIAVDKRLPWYPLGHGGSVIVGLVLGLLLGWFW